MNETRKLLLRAVAFCLSADQIAQIKRGFEAMDQDRNGEVT